MSLETALERLGTLYFQDKSRDEITREWVSSLNPDELGQAVRLFTANDDIWRALYSLDIDPNRLEEATFEEMAIALTRGFLKVHHFDPPTNATPGGSDAHT